MSTESQLERTVLEKKDRNQLSQIAGAMQVKSTSRTKKSDLIDLILVAAGVTAPAVATPAEVGEKARVVKSTVRARPKGDDSSSQHAHGRAAVEPSIAASGTDSAVPPPIVVTSSTMSRRRAATSRNGSNGHVEAPSTDELIVQEFTVKTVEETDKVPSEESFESRRAIIEAEGSSRRSRRRRGRDRGEREREPSTEPAAPVELADVEGILDLREEGFGFLRSGTYLPSPKDVYVAISVVRKYGLRKGDQVLGGARAANANEKYPALVRVDIVNGNDPEIGKLRPKFEELTPLFPDLKLAAKLDVQL